MYVRARRRIARVDEPVRRVARYDDEVARAQRHALIAERVIHLAIEDVDDLLAVRMHVLDVALPRIEDRESDRCLGARRVTGAHDPVHAAEVRRLDAGSGVAAHLLIDRRDIHAGPV
jgi:hypothetical protein